MTCENVGVRPSPAYCRKSDGAPCHRVDETPSGGRRPTPSIHVVSGRTMARMDSPSPQMLDLLFERCSEAVFTVARGSMRVVAANHRVEEVTGLSRQAII